MFADDWSYISTLSVVLLCFKLITLKGTQCHEVTTEEPNYELLDTSPMPEVLCDKHSYNRTCCNREEFQCGSGYCIPQEKICDSFSVNRTGDHTSSFTFRIRWLLDKADCSDGSDEIGCLAGSCATKTESTCPHNCIDLPENRSRCTCYKGYFLRVRGSQQICEDIDECKIGVHLCSHDCINLNGTFACGCRDGFQNDTDGLVGSCKAEDRNVQVLYNSDEWIYSYHVETKKRTALIKGRSTQNIEYDPVTDILYWNDDINIFRSFIPGAKGGNVTVGFAQPIGMFAFQENIRKESLAIDWTGGNIYWLEANALNNSNKRVMVSKLDGRYIKTISVISSAVSLVLDPEFGKMYWISDGDEALIGAAWMNGLFKWTIARLLNQKPTALTLDHLSGGRLYWADSKSSALYYIYKDGTRPTKIMSLDNRNFPISLDVFENHLYWITNSSGLLVRAEKFGRGKLEVLIENLNSPKCARIYHPRRVNREIRPGGLYCTTQCSHLCLHIPRGYSCSCPDGSKLISLMGEIVCDNQKEDEPEEPLICNCNDKQSVCNVSSPSHQCPCGLECPNQDDPNHLDTKYPLNDYSEFIIFSELILVIIVIILILTCCGLSFCKRSENR